MFKRGHLVRRAPIDPPPGVVVDQRLPFSRRRFLGAAAIVLILSSLLVEAGRTRVVAATGPMFVQATGSTTKTRFAFPSPITAGNLLVAGITTNDGGTDPITGVSDNLNGAWTKLTSLRYGNGHVELYYFAGTAGGPATVTFAGPQGAFTLAEYSGVQVSGAVDQFASRSSSSSTPTAGPTAVIGGSGELLVGIGGDPAPSSSATQFTAGTGFTIRAQAAVSFVEANGMEDALSASNAGQTMTMRSTASSYYGAIVAVFKAAPAAAPRPSLTVTPSSGAAPLAVSADGSASSDPIGIATYTFNFGDGTPVGPQTSPVANHTYASGGRFTVQLTIVDNANVSASATSAVTVGSPAAVLHVTPNTGATPLAVTADASGSTDAIAISSYTFSFGDGSAAVGPQPGATAAHTYTSAGTFTVTVTVADATGARSSATGSVTAQAPPQATLTVMPAAGASPLAVTANASASTAGSNPIVGYTFNFGDGTVIGPQAGATAAHTFASGGAFTVRATVTDSAGNASTASSTVTVGSPSAALTVAPSAGGAPLSVTASAAASVDAIPITSYTFDFGDGTIVGPQASSSAIHTYSAGGVYTVVATVADGSGATAAAATTVTIGAPHAALATTPSAGGAPLSVVADASGSTDPIAITSYRFDFGDGTIVGPQSGATASHVYASGGSFTVRATVTDGAGATSTATQTVLVGAPVARLTLSPSSGGAPLNVTADASTSSDPAGIKTYTFDFGDGTVVGPQAAPTAGHVYTSSGAYTLTATIVDAAGASASTSAVVNVTVPPSVSVRVTPSSGPAPLAVTADASASIAGTNPIATYTFDFGDGSKVGPQTAATASHSYTTGGSYTVTVTVTDTSGVSAIASASVTATAPPTASLVASPPSGATPLPVTADASASRAGSNPIATYTFDFGDGSALVGPQASPTATHTYGAAGTYTVRVTIIDTGSGTASATAVVTAVASPTAALSASPTKGGAPLLVNADASASTAGTNPISSYTFDFGDGSALIGPQTSPAASHTYTAGGVFVIRVTVTDSAGFSDSSARSVTIGAPSARLSVTPPLGAVPFGVTADATASADPLGISSYTFAFGDGTVVGPQVSPTATHTYTSAGTYTVTVSVSDSTGATSTASVQVSAANAPVASISLTPILGAVPLNVTASASGTTAGTNPIASYTFDFGDGTTLGPQPGATAAHGYTVAGTYTVKVTVTDTQGIASTATATLQAVAPPAVRLNIIPSSGGVPLSVTVDGSASTAGTNPIASYTCDFGDGSAPEPPSSTSSFNHVFSATGTFTVTMTVTDTAGVSASATAAVRVVNPPNAVVTASPNGGTAPLVTTADASGSTDALGIASYTFNFGDGTPAVGPQASPKASHQYATAGNFTVTVMVVDSASATSTASAPVNVLAPPTASLMESPISGYAPLTVSADASGSAGGSFTIASYAFSFGDGTGVVGPQTSPTTSHVYASPGTFTATVTVTDTHGNTATASATVSVASGVLVQDTFVRANQTGWGTASNGMPWSPSSSAMSIAGSEGVISNTASSLFATLGSGTTVDGNGVVRFSVASTSDTAGIALRMQSNGNVYLARYDGAGHLQFEYRVGSSWTHVAQVTFTPTLNAFYWLRFQIQGANLSMKEWPAGTAEPSTWAWQGSVTAIGSAGLMGLYAYAASGTPVSFDSFSVSAVGNPVPNSNITGNVIDATSGLPVAGVQVSTLPLTTTAVTNPAGAYSLNLPAGMFTVVFAGAASGYNANFLTNIQAPINGTVSANVALTVIPFQTAMDNYTRPNQSNGFGTSSDGHVWSSDLGVYPGAQAGVTAGQAWVDTQATSQTDFDTWMGYQYQNQVVSVDLNMNTILVDPVFQHGARLLTRVQNSSTWVLMAIDPTAQDLELWVAVNNNWTELIAVPQPVSTNVWYHAKLATVGNLVEGKIWQSGTSEPGWQISATQKLLAGGGQAGLRTTGAYIQYANFQQVPVTQISGVVSSQSTGSPIANAAVTLSNGSTTTTDATGSYTFSNLVGGTTYTVTASAAGENTVSVQATPAAGTTASASIILSP